jgi:NAD(P)-dependent dehydrogenase (short-subunit alcohol dehydrogenase family)
MPRKSRAAAAKLKSVGIVEPVVLDVADASSIEKAAAEVSSRYDSLDVLINNAGINYELASRQFTKAALNALTRTLVGELRGTSILVNAVCPSWVATDMGGASGRPLADVAAGILWAATLPGNGPTGGFFRDGKPLPW